MNPERRRLLFQVLTLLFVIALIVTFAIRQRSSAPPRMDERRLLMGTVVSVSVFGGEVEANREAVEAAFQEMAKVESLATRYSARSEISRINARAVGDDTLVIDREIALVLARALEIAAMSGGAFDPTIAPLVDLWSFDEDASVPDSARLVAARTLVDYTRVEVDAASGRLTIPASYAIDLDAIAKGYAVDRAISVLTEHGVDAALVDVGGDIRFLGASPRDDGWRVGIQHPRGDELLGVLELEGGSVATSGDYQRYTFIEGARYHHILDPSTGYPARGVMSVTVTAGTAMDADALATAVFVIGAHAGMVLIELLPGVETIIVRGGEEMGEVSVSSGLREAFTLSE